MRRFHGGIYRNIPFALMGVMVIILFFRSAQAHNDNNFRFMWLTVVLSFAFYIPVVLFADAYPRRYADDSENMRICLDDIYRIF